MWLARRHLFELRIRIGAHIRPMIQRPAGGIVVSVTTHPARISTFRLPLLSLLNQTMRPERVVLSLLTHEFPDRALPDYLTRLAERRRIEIIWAQGDMRSYAKLIPVLETYPDSTIVTADDDVLYPPTWLATLVRVAQRLPGAIVGYRARPTSRRPDGSLSPYAEWEPEGLGCLNLGRTTAREVMLTGVGGVLYPPGSLPTEVSDVKLARSICPTADDVWFWAMELRSSACLAVVPPGYVDFATAAGSQGHDSLMSLNLHGGANDGQIRAVLDHFGLWSALNRTGAD